MDRTETGTFSDFFGIQYFEKYPTKITGTQYALTGQKHRNFQRRHLQFIVSVIVILELMVWFRFLKFTLRDAMFAVFFLIFSGCYNLKLFTDSPIENVQNDRWLLFGRMSLRTVFRSRTSSFQFSHWNTCHLKVVPAVTGAASDCLVPISIEVEAGVGYLECVLPCRPHESPTGSRSWVLTDIINVLYSSCV